MTYVDAIEALGCNMEILKEIMGTDKDPDNNNLDVINPNHRMTNNFQEFMQSGAEDLVHNHSTLIQSTFKN